jgi:hypothetical protein
MKSGKSAAGRNRKASLGRGHARERLSKSSLLGSAPLLIARGLTESLAGRFETLTCHWSFTEMHTASAERRPVRFLGLQEGLAHPRFRPLGTLCLDLLIETTISATYPCYPVSTAGIAAPSFNCPAAIRDRSSLTPDVGEQDAGNATTLAHSSDLPAGARMVRVCRNTRGDRSSTRVSPKLQVLNTALRAPSG